MAKTTGLQKINNMGYGFYDKQGETVVFSKKLSNDISYFISINGAGECNKYYDTAFGTFGSERIKGEERQALEQFQKEAAAIKEGRKFYE